MLILRFLSGRQAGASWSARRFPVRVGRSPDSDLSVQDGGVWDHHFELQFQRARGIVLRSDPESVTRVNDERVEEAALRNGDVIEAGSLRLQFWLAPARQRGLRAREWFTWVLIAGISIFQVVLVYLFRYWE